MDSPLSSHLRSLEQSIEETSDTEALAASQRGRYYAAPSSWLGDTSRVMKTHEIKVEPQHHANPTLDGQQSVIGPDGGGAPSDAVFSQSDQFSKVLSLSGSAIVPGQATIPELHSLRHVDPEIDKISTGLITVPVDSEDEMKGHHQAKTPTVPNSKNSLYWTLCDLQESLPDSGLVLPRTEEEISPLVARLFLAREDASKEVKEQLMHAVARAASFVSTNQLISPGYAAATRSRYDLTKLRPRHQSVQTQMGRSKAGVVREPGRIPARTHGDVLFEEAKWMLSCFVSEKRAKTKLFKTASAAAAKYVNACEERTSKMREDEERRQRNVSKSTAASIRSFWHVVEGVVSKRAAEALTNIIQERRLARQRELVESARCYAEQIAGKLTGGAKPQEDGGAAGKRKEEGSPESCGRSKRRRRITDSFAKQENLGKETFALERPDLSTDQELVRETVVKKPLGANGEDYCRMPSSGILVKEESSDVPKANQGVATGDVLLSGSDSEDEQEKREREWAKQELEDEKLDEDMRSEHFFEDRETEMTCLEDEANMDLETLMHRYHAEQEMSDMGTQQDSSRATDEEQHVDTSLTPVPSSGSESKPSVEEMEQEESDKGEALTPVPDLIRAKLRHYQHEGLHWLQAIYTNNVNGILADEMGLGKTLQTIALLAHIAEKDGVWGPHLIIVPTSVLINWEKEFQKFLPGFRILVYYGNKKEREKKRQGWAQPFKFNVCLTSYTLAVADAHIFKRKAWYYMVLDEAQHIKNDESQRWKTLQTFNTQRRLLITGTPLQNSLRELWALLHFLMPSVFTSASDWKDLFSDPLSSAIETAHIGAERTLIQSLHTILRPFLLRRLKRHVEQEMPSKIEHVIPCPLSKRQRGLYDEFLHSRETVKSLTAGDYIGMMNVVMQLRKVCNHPDLFATRPVTSRVDIPELTLEACVPSLLCLHVTPQDHKERSVAECLELFSPQQHPLSSFLEREFAGETQRGAQWASEMTMGMLHSEHLRAHDPFQPAGVPRVRPHSHLEGLFDVFDDPWQVHMGLPELMLRHSAQPSGMESELAQVRSEGSWVHFNYVEWLRLQAGTHFLTDFFNPVSHNSWRYLSNGLRHEIMRAVGLAASEPCIAVDRPLAILPGMAEIPSMMELVFGRIKSINDVDPAIIVDGYIQERKRVTPKINPTDSIFGEEFALSAKPNAQGVRELKFIPRKSLEAVTTSDSRHDSTSAIYQNAITPQGLSTDWIRRQQQAALDKCEIDSSEAAVRVLGGCTGNPVAFQTILHDTPPLIGKDLRDFLQAEILNQLPMTKKPRPSNGREYLEFHEGLDQLIPTPEDVLRKCWQTTFRFIALLEPKVNARPQIHLTHPGPSAELGIDIPEGFPEVELMRRCLFPMRMAIQDDCGKLGVLARLLHKLRGEDHKVVLFTQMSKMLDILEAFVNLHGFTYVRLDGSTKVDMRMKIVDRFNDTPRIFLFLASTRAGGVGLNLTGADTVIFYDTDWNPAMDMQAMDRCHRIGQTRDVHVYRLLSRHTIEENIWRKQLQKRLLDTVVVDKGEFTSSNMSTFLSKVNVQEIFAEKDANEFDDIGTDRYFEIYGTRVLHDSGDTALENQLEEGPQGGAHERIVDESMDMQQFEEALARIEDKEDQTALSASKKEQQNYLKTFLSEFQADSTPQAVAPSPPTESVSGDVDAGVPSPIAESIGTSSVAEDATATVSRVDVARSPSMLIDTIKVDSSANLGLLQKAVEGHYDCDPLVSPERLLQSWKLETSLASEETPRANKKRVLRVDEKTMIEANAAVHYGVRWLEHAVLSPRVEAYVDRILIKLIAVGDDLNDNKDDEDESRTDVSEGDDGASSDKNTHRVGQLAT